MAVEMYRVDERMLHGQVLTTFAQIMQIDEFIVVNDIVAKDDEQKTLLELALPASAQMDVVSCKTFAKIAAENDYWGTKTFVVFRYIDDALECVKLGVKLDKLIVGGMYSRPDRPSEVKEEVALFVDDNDRKIFRELENAGVNLIYRVSAYQGEAPLNKVVKY